MKNIEFLACLLRVIGCWLLFGFFGDFAEAYNLYHKVLLDNSVEAAGVMFAVFLVPVVSFVISLLLVVMPVALSKFLLPRDCAGDSSFHIQGGTLSISMLSVLGIYIVSQSLVDSVFNFLTLINYRQHDLADSYEYDETIAYQISTFVQLVLGFYLVFNAKKIYSKIMPADGNKSVE